MNNVLNRLLGRKKLCIFKIELEEESFAPNPRIIEVRGNRIIFFVNEIRIVRKEDGTLVFRGPSGDSGPDYLDQHSIAVWLMDETCTFLEQIERGGGVGERAYSGWLSKARVKELFFQYTGRYLPESAMQAARKVSDRLLDAEVLGLIPGQVDYCYVTPAEYNKTAPQSALLRKLQQESSTLFPLLYAAIQEDVIALRPDCMAQMKNLMVRKGHTPAAWRYLLKMPQKTLDLVVRGEGNARRSLSLVFALAGILEATRIPPSDFLLLQWAVALVRRFHGARRRLPPTWFRIAAIKEEESQEEKEIFIEQYEQALAWLQAVRPLPNKQQKRAGWAWIVRQVNEWAYEQWKKSLRHTREWGSSIEAYCDVPTELILQPLTSKRALVEEGDAMHHCVGRFGYDELCRNAEARIFSIRRDFRRVATAELRIRENTGGWQLWSISGPCNKAVPEHVLDAGYWLAGLYSGYANAADNQIVDVGVEVFPDAGDPDDDPDDPYDDDDPDGYDPYDDYDDDYPEEDWFDEDE